MFSAPHDEETVGFLSWNGTDVLSDLALWVLQGLFGVLPLKHIGVETPKSHTNRLTRESWRPGGACCHLCYHVSQAGRSKDDHRLGRHSFETNPRRPGNWSWLSSNDSIAENCHLITEPLTEFKIVSIWRTKRIIWFISYLNILFNTSTITASERERKNGINQVRAVKTRPQWSGLKNSGQYIRCIESFWQHWWVSNFNTNKQI